MTYYLLGRDGGGGKTCLPLFFSRHPVLKINCIC